MWLKNDSKIDILNDPVFETSNTIFANYTKSLKDKGKGSVTHYPVISPNDLKKVPHTLDKNNPQELQLLTWFYIMFYFCRRGRENLCNMKKEDLIFYETDGKTVIALKNESTKNHSEIDEDSENGGRIVETKEADCPVKLIRLYLSKLNARNDNLWQKPKPSTESEEWYYNVNVGINTLGKFMKTISQKCKFDKSYTNHSLRVSACTILGGKFGDIDVQSVSKHKSLNSLSLYKRTDDQKRLLMATELSKNLNLSEGQKNPSTSSIGHQSNPNQSEDLNLIEFLEDAIPDDFLNSTMPDDFLNSTENESNPSSDLKRQKPIINFNNCSNFTVNFN